ncbi:MFS general substrate transporter [Schizophyllum commune H4-8]|uniref:Major facilitator superfamily (MFS) profile domain-containing protein n=1 Tax=Schizophyllum commune (strain H4-8 / FGSC 9210) TaxID=578458 RepID=D8PSQ3_SCHCM|nr:MFS general substrate transporter [Schizophyllum commune H4-8]KAI5899598.1 MFS general substrate transporter [Schizophyllum commune H4-8]
MSRTRFPISRTPSTAPTTPGALLRPDGSVNDEATGMLHDIVHHHERTDVTIVEEETPRESKDGRPWYKRPSPWWILAIIPFTTMAMSGTLAPKIEIYTRLVCRVHRPDLFKDTYHYDPATTEGILGKPRPANGMIDPHDTFPHPVARETVLHFAADEGEEGPTKPTCASDPLVQRIVAQLSAAMTLSMGVLACLTTGWWGSFSDRHGRRSVMGISVFGLLLTDLIFIFVTLYPDTPPGGYWFLVVGPLVEGTLGGMTAASAAMHAYLSDTTKPAERARSFSMFMGMLFIGVAFGPTLGALLIREAGLIYIFFVTTIVHIAYTLYVWFILPESVSKESQHASALQYQESLEVTTHERRGSRIRALLKRMSAFLTPLAVFYPYRTKTNGNPLKAPTRDWSLVFIALAYGFTTSIMGSYNYTFQYASSTFGWSSEQLGYFLSSVGAVRATVLVILVPLILKIFKPAPETIEFYQDDESAPLLSRPGAPRPQVIVRKEIHSPLFDLRFARACLAVEVVAYSFMALARHAWAYVGAAMGAAIGAALPAALQSVALDIYVRRGGSEAGKLFGALSVVQALSSQIAGPSLFALVYMNTVATFPSAIFFVAVGLVAFACILLIFVRIPDHKNSVGTPSPASEDEESRSAYADSRSTSPMPDLGREVTLVELGSEEDLNAVRGRKGQVGGETA